MPKMRRSAEPFNPTDDELMSIPVEQSISSPVDLPNEPIFSPGQPWACDDCGESFRRESDLSRHRRTVHFTVFQDCPVPDCSRKDIHGFQRRDHLVEHLREYHHMDAPKRQAARRETGFGGASSTASPSPGSNEHAASVSSYGRMFRDAEVIPENATSRPSGMPIGSRRSPYASHPPMVSPSLFNASRSVVSALNSVDSGYGSASFHPPSSFAKYAKWETEPSLGPGGSGHGDFHDSGILFPVSRPKLLGHTVLEDLYIPGPVKHRYVCLLARLIAESVACYKPTHYVIDQICEALPDLLEQFALSIGENNYSVMAVLLRYKRPKDYLQQIQDLDEEYLYPGAVNDKLYMPSYPHAIGEAACTSCSPDGEQQRPPRQSSQPVIHYGTIASGNKVIRDAATRDRWGNEHNVLCFEMEAAGIMNILPSLIIRGICDYCDSHKNKLWQRYAAASAAAFAKLLLSHIRPESEE